jgi:hypothetical protein
MPRKKKDSPPSAFAAKVLSLVEEGAPVTAGHVAAAPSSTEPDPEPSVTQSPQAEPDGSGFGPFTLEEMFTAEWGSKIDTATPCQRAICRLLDGLPIGDVANDVNVQAMFGGVVPEIDGRPDVAMILGGIRTCKSTIIADTAIVISQTIEIPDWVRPSDEVRIPIVSVDKDTAQATFAHVRDTILSSPRLYALLSKDENGKTIEPKADSLLLRHPSGRDIEVKVVALSRAGSTLTARWFPAAIFDEAPLMGSEADFVRNFDEAFGACLGRILPGGLIMLAGSPHARIGPVYKKYREHHGKPTRGFVVTAAKAYWLNPIYWTPERCEKLRIANPTRHQTDVECEFKDPELALGDSASIEAAMRKVPGNIKPIDGHHYRAFMDPATRVNTWTLVILECSENGLPPKYRVAFNQQWVPKPGATLSPSAVFKEQAETLKVYGLTECHSDIAGTDFAIELAAQHGIELLIETGLDMLELGRTLMAFIKRGILELPDDPQMREDLQTVRTRTSSNGGVTIYLPKTEGGRHCDYFPPLCGLMGNLPEPPDETIEVTMQQKDLEREIADFASRNDDTDGARASRKASGW